MPTLEQSKSSPHKLGERAIVLGSGIAGLLSAQALSRHFHEVTVLERDELPSNAQPRPGVPQSRHVHLLLARGAAELDRAFPDFTAELVANGAERIDFTQDVVSLLPFGWLPRLHTGIYVYGCTRPLIETLLRARLAQVPNVRFCEGVSVRELAPRNSPRAFPGVRVQDEGCGRERVERAELVVDALGRGSQAPRWLEQLGCGSVEEQVIDPKLGYASQLMERPSGWQADWKLMSTVPIFPKLRRGGTIFPVEGGRWLVLMVGINADYPPTRDEAFLAFSRELATPRLHETLVHARPLSRVHGFRGTENRFLHYERMQRWPEGFVVIGDAACRFNPYYGQGMTVATLGAAVLSEELGRAARASERGLSRRIQARIARMLAVPWMMATGEDRRWPLTTGATQPTAVERLMVLYMEQLTRLIPHDEQVARTFFRAVHMLTPPTQLVRGPMLSKVLVALGKPGISRLATLVRAQTTP